jgi:Ribbon-helix-helix protein, copG family
LPQDAAMSPAVPVLRTSCDNVYMSVNVSVRLDDDLAERLRVRARAAGESLSDRLRRYAEEGARRDEHPLITFRDGPTGRRAGLLGGPDVWEVVMWLDDLADEPDPAAALAADGVVTRTQIDAAMHYRRAYPDEIEARIELHRHETAAAGAG